MGKLERKEDRVRRVDSKIDNNEFTKNCRGDQNEKNESIGIVFKAGLLTLV